MGIDKEINEENKGNKETNIDDYSENAVSNEKSKSKKSIDKNVTDNEVDEEKHGKETNIDDHSDHSMTNEGHYEDVNKLAEDEKQKVTLLKEDAIIEKETNIYVNVNPSTESNNADRDLI